MKKYLQALIVISFLIFGNSPVIAANKVGGDACTPGVDTCVPTSNYDCLPDPNPGTTPPFWCQPTSTSTANNPFSNIFGKITPPDPIKGFAGSGSAGISSFLTNLVALIYSIATIVFIFMLLWGAFDWITSEGNKEKIDSARNKILQAIVGILLFGAAFAIIQILGTFTGFKFFTP